MNPILRILQFTKQFWKWYVGLGTAIIIISLLGLIGPFLNKRIIDIIVGQLSGSREDLNQIFIILGISIAIDLVITLLTAISQWLGDIFSEKLQTYLSSTFYKHVLSLHIGYFDNEITGKINNKMTRGIERITDFIQNMLNNFLPFVLTAVLTIILLAHYSPIIAVLLTALFPLYILISHKSTTAWQKHETEKNAVRDQSYGRVFESLSAIRIVKSFATEASELASYLTSRHTIEKVNRQQTKEWHIYDFLRRSVLNIILFAIFAYVVYWTFKGHFTIGEMTLLVQLVNQARFPLFAMSWILGQIQLASAGSKDFFEILATKSQIADTPNAKQLIWKKDKHPAIEFDQVSFAYTEDKPVLNDVSFVLEKGDKLALVGESGEGKSTIANLIMRFYEPQHGTVKISGLDVKSVTQESLHQNIGVVLQESLLFSGTIEENIRYGNEQATDKQVISAAKAANAHEFIDKLPKGYKSVIGERGVKLSGGQKQRISIARAILKNAPLIILDEATSALDSRSELAVQKGLEELLKGRASIIIAHRLSTVSHADHILVLSQGKVAQFGTPGNLLADKKGMYSRLVALQAELLKAPSEQRKAKLKEFDLVG